MSTGRRFSSIALAAMVAMLGIDLGKPAVEEEREPRPTPLPPDPRVIDRRVVTSPRREERATPATSPPRMKREQLRRMKQRARIEENARRRKP